MNEFRVTDQGELDLGLAAPPTGPRPAARPPRGRMTAAAACPPGARPSPTDDGPGGDWPADDLADWDFEPGDDGDPETGPDDYQAWLAGLPAAVRADFLAGAWTGEGRVDPGRVPAPPARRPVRRRVRRRRRPGHPRPRPVARRRAHHRHRRRDRRARAAGRVGADRGAVRLAADRVVGRGRRGRRRPDPRQAPRRRAAGPAGSRQAEHVTDEIAAALTLTGRSAGRLLTIASALARTPDVLTALKAGGIDWAKAAVFADELAPLADDGVAAGIAGRYLGRAGAGGWTTGQLRAALRRAVLAADPDAAGRRRDDARADAAVTVWDEASGNAALAGRELPPAEVLTADARLTALAKWLQARGAPGTISQLRAAVYTALLNGRPVDSLLPDASADASGADAAGTSEAGPASADGVPGGAAPAGPAVSGSIHLTMPLTAFLGSGREPGEVAGHGPVDAATSRDLAAILARIRRHPVVPHPHRPRRPRGRARLRPARPRRRAARHPVGRRPARPAPDPRDRQLPPPPPGPRLRPARHCSATSIGVRQRRCAHPGCRRPAARCDLDHTIPYDHGGRKLAHCTTG